jgi:hypothetical protein
VLAELIDKASEEITTSLLGNMDGTSDDEAAAKRQKAREKDKRYRVRKGPDKEWRKSRCESSRLHKEQNRAAIQKRDREQKRRKKLLASQSVPSVEVEIEEPTALNIRNERPEAAAARASALGAGFDGSLEGRTAARAQLDAPNDGAHGAAAVGHDDPRSANESAEPQAIGESVLGVPFADEMNLVVVAEPGSNEEHTGNEEQAVPEEGGPGGSGDDVDDDGGGTLPFEDDGGVVPMVEAGGDDGEGPPTLTEGATGSTTGPEGSETGGPSLPNSTIGIAGSSLGPADSARGPSTSGDDNNNNFNGNVNNHNNGSAPPVPDVLLARAQGAIEVHVQEKKDLHGKLVEALVSNALLQKRVLVLEQQQQQQQQRDGAVQALPTDGTTQAREEEPDGPSRIADADRLRQLEASNAKLEDDLRELEELDREREAATDAQAKQHLEAYEKLRGDLKAEKQAREKDVGDLQRQLNESRDRHMTELASLKRQHEAELDAKQKSIQDQEQLIKKYKRENEELKKRGASVKAEPGRGNEPDQQRSSRVSVKEEPGRDPQPEQQRSSSISVKAEPGCDLQPDQPRSSNGASSSSAPRSNAKGEKGSAGTGKK